MAIKTAVKTAAKKPVKKSVKKAARKAAPKSGRLTVKALAEIWAQDIIARTAAAEKFMAGLDKLGKDVDRVSAKYDDLSDRVDDVSDNVGGLNRRLGQIMELIVIPYLRLDLNAKGGHNFEDMRGNRKVNAVIGDKKNTVAEMDVFLYGPAETMAVEIKTHMKRSDVAKHLERLKTLRFYETEAEIKGKKLFGGMIGLTVDDDARKFAKKNGLYVIGIHEVEDKLLIDAPEQRGEW